MGAAVFMWLTRACGGGLNNLAEMPAREREVTLLLPKQLLVSYNENTQTLAPSDVNMGALGIFPLRVDELYPEHLAISQAAIGSTEYLFIPRSMVLPTYDYQIDQSVARREGGQKVYKAKGLYIPTREIVGCFALNESQSVEYYPADWTKRGALTPEAVIRPIGLMGKFTILGYGKEGEDGFLSNVFLPVIRSMPSTTEGRVNATFTASYNI